MSFIVTHNPGATLQGGPDGPATSYGPAASQGARAAQGATLQDQRAALQHAQGAEGVFARTYFSLVIESLPNGGYIIYEGRLPEGDYRQALAGFTEKRQALEWIASNLK